VAPTASAYAVFIHRGSLGKLAATYEGIYRTWLPNSDYALAGSYDFEAYPASFDLEDETRCVLEIWVPVNIDATRPAALVRSRPRFPFPPTI